MCSGMALCVFILSLQFHDHKRPGETISLSDFRSIKIVYVPIIGIPERTLIFAHMADIAEQSIIFVKCLDSHPSGMPACRMYTIRNNEKQNVHPIFKNTHSVVFFTLRLNKFHSTLLWAEMHIVAKPNLQLVNTRYTRAPIISKLNICPEYQTNLLHRTLSWGG